MKKTEENYTKEYKAVVFTAEDGTQFYARGEGYPSREAISRAENECREYEQTCKHAVNLQFKNISKKITGKMHSTIDCFINGGNDTADYYYVKPSNSAEIETILKYMKLFGENSMESVSRAYSSYSYADELEIGKGYIIAYWPESPWTNLYGLDKMMNLMTAISHSLETGEEATVFAP